MPPRKKKPDRNLKESKRDQINLRLDADLMARLDEKRVALRKVMAKIPSRSEVVRLAIEEYLKAKQTQGSD